MTQVVVASRLRNYYRAQAGLVDARERIRNNKKINGFPATGFDDPASTISYFLDIDNDAAFPDPGGGAVPDGSDVRVTIWPQVNGLREIDCQSIGI